MAGDGREGIRRDGRKILCGNRNTKKLFDRFHVLPNYYFGPLTASINGRLVIENHRATQKLVAGFTYEYGRRLL